MTLKTLLAVAAAFAATAVYSQDDESAETETASTEAETSEEAGDEAKAEEDKKEVNPFATIPFCRKFNGKAEALKPGCREWVQVEEGRFYPLGTSYRTGENGEFTLAFGRECMVKIGPNGAFSTKAQPLGEKSRTVIMQEGVMNVVLPTNLRPGRFFVCSSVLTVRDPAGESSFAIRRVGDGTDTSLRCITGVMTVEGRHFTVPKMISANEFRLRSSRDELETILYGVSGNFVVLLEKGIVTRPVFDEEGVLKNVSELERLDWHLSPFTRVQINRAVPAVGERMCVTMMTFDSSGKMKNHFAYAEGRSEINSGELVIENREGEEDKLARKVEEVAGKDGEEKNDGEDADSGDGSSADEE